MDIRNNPYHRHATIVGFKVRKSINDTDQPQSLEEDLQLEPIAAATVEEQLGKLRNELNADSRVIDLRRNQQFGDPVGDLVAMWLALEAFHEHCRLTDEGWAFLGNELQRPIEERLLERKPRTLDGALKALNMAAHIMENLEDDADGAEGDWYKKLRLHLLNGARDILKTRLGDFNGPTKSGAPDL